MDSLIWLFLKTAKLGIRVYLRSRFESPLGRDRPKIEDDGCTTNG